MTKEYVIIPDVRSPSTLVFSTYGIRRLCSGLGQKRNLCCNLPEFFSEPDYLLMENERNKARASPLLFIIASAAT